MFGLSAAKIALLIAVIAAIVFGTRVIRALGRPDPRPDPSPGPPREPDAFTPSQSADAAEAKTATLERCPRCGAYADPADHRCDS